MAYEGVGFSTLWKPDLNTRAGAMSAMSSAKFGFLILGGFRLIMGIFSFLPVVQTMAFTDYAVALAVMVIESCIPLVAAWRLHLNKGAFIAPLATILYVLGVLFNVFMTKNPLPLVIGFIFTAVFVSGCRGAWALHRGTGFDDEVYDTFG